MKQRKPEGSLTAEERRIVKALLERGWRNQDIQDLMNRGRVATINSARITEVKKNPRQVAAADHEVDQFIYIQDCFDFQTGLNRIRDERLVRSREAMILAVHCFNSPGTTFKTESFAVLSIIAWTYMLHEYYQRREVKIQDENGRSISLGEMIDRADCPLSDGVKININALRKIRNEVEHLLLGASDDRYYDIYQSCAINYETWITKLFGNRLSLGTDLAVAIQFSKIQLDQVSNLHSFEVPARIQALDAALINGLTENQINDIEFRLRVVFSMTSSSKTGSHIRFIHPESEEGREISNVLIKHKPADERYIFKPLGVVREVSKIIGTQFNMRNHTQAWMLFKVRPKNGSKKPQKTDLRYCCYNKVHGDYTYSEEWVKKLVDIVQDHEAFQKLKAVKV